MNAQQVKTFSNTGSGEEYNSIEYQYRTTQVTVKGLATGTFTLKVKAHNSNVYESIDGNVIDLASNRTLVIRGVAIDELACTVSAGTAYTLEVTQSDYYANP